MSEGGMESAQYALVGFTFTIGVGSLALLTAAALTENKLLGAGGLACFALFMAAALYHRGKHAGVA